MPNLPDLNRFQFRRTPRHRQANRERVQKCRLERPGSVAPRPLRGWGRCQNRRGGPATISAGGAGRAVRMVFEHQGDYPSPWKAIESISAKLSIDHERCASGCGGLRPTPGSGRADDRRAGGLRARAGERSCGGLTRSSRRRRLLRCGARPPITRSGRVHRRAPRPVRGRADLPGAHRERLQVPRTPVGSPQQPPSKQAQQDAELVITIRHVYEESLLVYGADKVWAQLNREGLRVARFTVERLMRAGGCRSQARQGARRHDPRQRSPNTAG